MLSLKITVKNNFIIKYFCFDKKLELIEGYVSLTDDELNPGVTNKAVNNILLGELIKGLIQDR